MNEKRSISPVFSLVLCAVVLASISLFLICYKYDNKYTAPRPMASQGYTHIDMEWYDSHPFFYLIDGWEFYHGALSFQELSQREPDAYTYIGRYGGFDLGDPEANPHGSATYRTVLVTDGEERSYALELTRIYSAWRLWINGELVQSVGRGEQTRDNSNLMVTFSASDKVEIVVQVWDDTHFYSGMVYPPAFGSPSAVERIFTLRLLMHGAFCAFSLLIAIFCLFMGFWHHLRKPYPALALLCICACGSATWPLLQALGYWDEGFLVGEQVCFYGMYVALTWVLGQVCKVPKWGFWPACGTGLVVAVSLIAQPFFPVSAAWQLMLYANLLGAYKWLSAIWIVMVSFWALGRELPYAKSLTSGSCLFATSLVMDKLLPVHEPIVTGWFAEVAGVILVFLAAGIAWYDTVQVYRESSELRQRRALQEIRLEAWGRQAVLQKEYVRRTRQQLHESRHRLTLIRHYAEKGEHHKLMTYLDSLMPKISQGAPAEYTGNSLVDAILGIQFSLGETSGIYVEYDCATLPSQLPLSDDDITSVLMNVLNNAIEGCLRIAEPEERWVSFKLGMEDGLVLECRNSAVPDTGQRTSKKDREAHGYGLSILKSIARRCNGELNIHHSEDTFELRIRLFEPEPKEE